MCNIWCRAHMGSCKSAQENQEPKQVTVASSTTPPDVLDRLYSKPYHYFVNQELEAICNGTSGTEIITIPEHIAATITGAQECAFVGRESDSDSTETEALCCDGGATSSLSSSFINCTEVKERVVPIQTAQGGTVMMTTHVCLKTYYVRDRTGELRPLTTKTYIVKNLKHDLLSGKGLNKAGYRVIYDEDPEESGVYAVNDGKICKSKSFPFMSEHSNLFYLKTEPLTEHQFGKMSGYELWHRRLGHCSN